MLCKVVNGSVIEESLAKWESIGLGNLGAWKRLVFEGVWLCKWECMSYYQLLWSRFIIVFLSVFCAWLWGQLSHSVHQVWGGRKPSNSKTFPAWFCPTAACSPAGSPPKCCELRWVFWQLPATNQEPGASQSLLFMRMGAKQCPKLYFLWVLLQNRVLHL